MHTFHLAVGLILFLDDPWVDGVVVHQGTPFPHNLWTVPWHFFWCALYGVFWCAECVVICGIKAEAHGFLAITLHIPCCRTYAADITVENLPRWKSEHLLEPHCGWYGWKVSWHLFHCILHSLLLNVKRHHLRLSLTQGLVQGQCCGDINSLADKPVGPPLQRATHTIWGTFAMAGFKLVPGSSCESLLEDFSTKKVKNYHAACTVCRDHH